MKNFPPEKIFQSVVKTILFVFCGVPGAFITAFSVIIFIISLTGKEHSTKNPLYAVLWFILGSCLLLVGLRKTQPPPYLPVIRSFPCLIFAPALPGGLFGDFTSQLEGILDSTFFLSLFVIPFLVKKRVDRFYAEKPA
ncbi:MAG TPA: hypothetical protein VF604_17080 [Pyrinomonadaceae bacterium]|jgi:hypothetical protein